jgi:hypothetical protein
MNVQLFARYAVRAVIVRLRARRRRQVAGPEPTGPLDPLAVGRQESRGEAILDTAAWLESGAWGGDERGEVQCYAAYLLAARARYEHGTTRTQERT